MPAPTTHPFTLFARQHFADALLAARRAEDERRTEAFLDFAPAIAGVRLRPITPRDIFLLDGFSSPFVCGDPARATEPHLCAVLWLLSPRRAGLPGLVEWFAYALHTRRLRRRWRDVEQRHADHADLILMFERTFADLGAPASSAAEGAAPATHFLSSFLVPLAVQMGIHDPVSGALLYDTPLARLVQYSRTLARQAGGDRHIDFNPTTDRVRADALAAYNALSPEERAQWEARAATDSASGEATPAS